ncbi:HAD family hydrolase [candidate division KSB1 bacterium]|nr:HAD family hydrolase [candidate division KSB1 bacterium]
MKTIDTLIFDFDGTLADTYPIIFHSFQTIFKEFKNQEITGKEIVAMFGPAEDEIIRRQFSAADLSAVIERYYEAYHLQHDALVQPQPEINHMLRDLKRRGYKLGIFTGKGRRSLNISLRHLFDDDLFDATVTGDEVSRHKPDPEGALKALAMLGSEPARAVFLGDSEFDFLAGRAAGMSIIAVAWFHEDGPLRAKADLILRRKEEAAELHSLLTRLPSRGSANV